MKFSIATVAPFKLSSYPFKTLESSVTPASTTTAPFSILLFTITATVSPGDVVIAGPSDVIVSTVISFVTGVDILSSIDADTSTVYAPSGIFVSGVTLQFPSLSACAVKVMFFPTFTVSVAPGVAVPVNVGFPFFTVPVGEVIVTFSSCHIKALFSP